MADAVNQQKNLISCKVRANPILESFYKLKHDVKHNGQKHLAVRGAQVNRCVEMPHSASLAQLDCKLISWDGDAGERHPACRSLRQRGCQGVPALLCGPVKARYPKAGAKGRIYHCHHASLQQFSV